MKPKGETAKRVGNLLARKGVAEEAVVFLGLFKWVAFATLIGLATGASTAAFLKILEYLIRLHSNIPYYYVALPAALFVNALVLMYFQPKENAYSGNAVIKNIHSGKSIGIASILKAFFLPLITISAGGSGGKEAPAANVGAGIASIIGNSLHINSRDQKLLMVSGLSAGFAAVFGTPLAGAVFGVEVLFVGGLLYEALLPAIVAGIVGYQTASFLGITYFQQSIAAPPMLDAHAFVWAVAAGIFFAGCSVMLIEMNRRARSIARGIKMWAPMKAASAGVLIVLLAVAFSDKYLGLGIATIEHALGGGGVQWFDFILKALFTSITLNFGGIAGIVTPVVFIGATAGSFFAQVFGLHAATFAALGLVSVLAGTISVPIAASIMAVELFGPGIAPYAMLACIVSYLGSGHRSVYASQVLASRKSSESKATIGAEVEQEGEF